MDEKKTSVNIFNMVYNQVGVGSGWGTSREWGMEAEFLVIPLGKGKVIIGEGGGGIDRHMGDGGKLGWDAEFFHQFL